MNILVTGSNGQLGTELRNCVSASCPGQGAGALMKSAAGNVYVFTDVTDVPGADTVHLDITDLSSVEKAVNGCLEGPAEGLEIDLVINCAAYTNVDKAEVERDAAELLNAAAVRNLAVSLNARNGFLVHISTDYVFGGTDNNTPCTEDQPANPTGVYGETKLHGEQEVIASGCRHIIIRTAWLYSEYGRNFLKTMLNLTAARPHLDVVFDQTGTPTYAGDLAEAVFDIVEHRKYENKDGIYHYSNEGVCSWYDFAEMIAEYSGHTSCDIRPCHSNEFPSPVKRPSYSVLDKTRIKQAFGLRIPYWTASLKKCIDNINNAESHGL